MENKSFNLKNLSYSEVEEILDKCLATEIKHALELLGSDYKELSEVLDYGEPGYIHKLLHVKKKPKLATLIKLSYGLTLIKDRKNVVDVDEEYLMPWSILKRACIRAFSSNSE